MAVGDAHVFPGFLTPVLTQLFFPKPPTTFLTCFCRGERQKYTGKKPNKALTLSQTSPGFYLSAVQVFWKHCGKMRNCLLWAFLLFPQCFLPVLRAFCLFHQIWNCCLQTLCVWKSLKFVVLERVKWHYWATKSQHRHHCSHGTICANSNTSTKQHCLTLSQTTKF